MPLLPLDAVEVQFDFPDDATLSIQATAKATARTGVEMEALTAVIARRPDCLRHVQGGGSRDGD